MRLRTRAVNKVMIGGILCTFMQLFGQTGTQWSPYMEWEIPESDVSYSGNHFDVIAAVKFTHSGSGDTVRTLMFYDSTDTWEGWKFRFTGTKTGTWNYESFSDNADLDRRAGSVTINENPDPGTHGFLRNFGNRWGWQGTETAFVPQLVMFPNPAYQDQVSTDERIQTFIAGHGFSGFHFTCACQWFQLGEGTWDNLSEDPNPDPETFQCVEYVIAETHAAGGMVHIWQWGDAQHRASISRWGYDSDVHHRLLRYIAGRLGPLPGWSMGYGFDLGTEEYEGEIWGDEEELEYWHFHLHQYFGGWPHFLGGRPAGPNTGTDHSPYISWNDGLDYSSYEHHLPDINVYMAAFDAIPNQPVFSEDRFRIRGFSPEKDYTELMTIRGLYYSTMAGGVANIWGNFMNSSWVYEEGPGYSSLPYDSAACIKTYATFMQDRFHQDMVRDNTITDGYCLKRPNLLDYIFYIKDASSVDMDLSGMPGPRFAIAVNALAPYAEIGLGWLEAQNQTVTLPSQSDWAVAVGFGCTLKSRIFLEGAYESSSSQMRLDLNTGDEVPLTAPYEEDLRTVEEIPSGVVDWVLVQLRETASGDAVISRSSFLHQDGRVVADDGITGQIWLEIDPGNYYIVINHRNHLPVMSADPVGLE
ncbi:DUF5060 domain-containing protein [bacterium]|nr:DUF5060 domain-containing protein [bacterium]